MVLPQQSCHIVGEFIKRLDADQSFHDIIGVLIRSRAFEVMPVPLIHLLEDWSVHLSEIPSSLKRISSDAKCRDDVCMSDYNHYFNYKLKTIFFNTIFNNFIQKIMRFLTNHSSHFAFNFLICHKFVFIRKYYQNNFLKIITILNIVFKCGTSDFNVGMVVHIIVLQRDVAKTLLDSLIHSGILKSAKRLRLHIDLQTSQFQAITITLDASI
jgi:hypothetical protein